VGFWFFEGPSGRQAALRLARAATREDYHRQTEGWLDAYEKFLAARTARPVTYPWPTQWPDDNGRDAWYRQGALHVGVETLPREAPSDGAWAAAQSALTAVGGSPPGAFPLAAVFSDLLAPTPLLDRSEREHRLLAGFIALSLADTETTRTAVFDAAVWHSDPSVRSLALGIAHLHYPSPAASRYICAATHDTDDLVFVRAFRTAGRLRLEAALLDLLQIVTPGSLLELNVTHNRDAVVVGLAAANALAACCAIFGTGNPAVLKKREAEFRARSYSPLFARHIEIRAEFEREPAPTYSPVGPASEPADIDEMVCVPAGPFLFGADPQQIPFLRFDSSRYTPLQLAFTETFFIDRYPVTNADYDRFVETLEGGDAARHEHPDQPAGKIHRRNTWDDPRFGSEHPVTGIDWYDAYAYASWRGKALPTELEWEKACRGTDGRLFPWGDDWDPGRLHCAHRVFERPFERILDWRAELARFDRTFPATTTAPVHAHEADGASPFGVVDMLGNAWEYTCTNADTGREMQPRFKHLKPADFMNAPEAQVVIKGGAWSSIPELTSAPFRGIDLLTDRHNEIGFRCVYRPK
jgi:formylglycine-generating enzyme required for sulfatase activity